ncbi:MAG TPA: hypothetical protein VF245_00780 [Solirubrobacterales bacterium]
MSSRRLPSAAMRFLTTAALAAMGGAALATTPATAAYPDACGLVTQHEMAKAFGLTDSVPHQSTLREPGNPAGVVHTRCRAFAWRGQKPTNAARRNAGMLAGTVATFRIEVWAADSGPAAETWLANFPNKLDGLTSRAKAQFLEGALNGRSLTLPRLGYESTLGYQAPSGGLRKLRAFWWNRSTGTLISFNVVESRDRPVGMSLKNLASEIVPKVE